jgi:ABC-type phosphate/phosphonate transport system substrate-binding protein
MVGVPGQLDRNRPLASIWNDPALLLAQTCGYPFMTSWRQLRYVATLCYGAPGCEGPLHRSRIVVRADDPATSLADFRNRPAAVNDFASNTGMNLFRAALAPHTQGPSFFQTVIESGSHADSARLVVSGKADIAAIDCVSYAHLEHSEPDLTASLRTLAWSTASPGLPLVTAAATSQRDIKLLRRALIEVLEDEEFAGHARRLLITGVHVLGVARYRPVLAIERWAATAGYPQLR